MKIVFGTILFFSLVLVFPGWISGQVTDTIVISDSRTFSDFVLGKSTIKDVEKKYGAYNSADTIVNSWVHATLAGGGCWTIAHRVILYSFLEKRLIVTTEITSDTIQMVIIKYPLAAVTTDHIILGKSTISQLVDSKNLYSPRPGTLPFIDKNIWYLEQNGISYGYKSSTGNYCKRIKRKRITQFLIGD